MTAKPIIYDFDPRNLPADLLRAVGLVTAAAAQTENIVQQFIGGLLGIDEIETIALTSHMAGPLKDQVARALIELNARDAWAVDAVDDLLDAIKSATEKRNTLVHNALARHPETNEVFSIRYQSRGSLQSSMQRIDVHQVEKDAALIYEVGIDLMRFMTATGILPTSRTRPMGTPLDRGKKARETRKSRRVRDPK